MSFPTILAAGNAFLFLCIGLGMAFDGLTYFDAMKWSFVSGGINALLAFGLWRDGY